MIALYHQRAAATIERDAGERGAFPAFSLGQRSRGDTVGDIGGSGVRRWVGLGLITLFMAINSADKSVIGLAGPRIMRDLRLTPEQFGLIGSSFFFLFSASAANGTLGGGVSPLVNGYFVTIGPHGARGLNTTMLRWDAA